MPESLHSFDPFDANFAVVIGINQYQNGISELGTARFDAERLADILEKKYGYEVALFTDETDKRATSENIWNHLNTELSQKIKADENKRVRLLFYFAGHGTPPKGEDGEAGYLCLLPQDAEIGKTDIFLSMKKVHDVLTQLGCHHLLIILDCCYAGAFRFGTRDIGVIPEEISKERYQRYFEFSAGQVITSTAHNQKAIDILKDNRGKIENSQHSPFAELLFKALEDGDADSTKDGISTVTELNLYISDKLLELTRNHKYPQVSRTWFLPTLDQGEFFFQTGEFDPDKLPEAITLNKDNNPYRGLKSFEEAHSRFFFGRSEKIQKLQERLSFNVQIKFWSILLNLDCLAGILFLRNSHPLTVVVGISGSGKSSLVKAGLIPRLRENRAQWRILEPIRPGATPFKALAKALLPLDLEDSDPDLEPLKQLDELLRQARRKDFNNQQLKDLYAKWRRTSPEDKLLLIIQHFDRFKSLCIDPVQQQSLEALRKIGLSRSRLVLDKDKLKELKQYSNPTEQEQLDILYQECSEKIQVWSDTWRLDGKQFGEFIVKYCPKNKQVKLLLVIDQFEELIAPRDRKERKQFLDALQAALKACPEQLRLVLTLRSDFQHHFENSEQLKDYWQKACFRVDSMGRDQLREAIEQPGLVQVLYFETKEDKSLVDQLLDDIGDTPGALPLLSFTLSELYYKYVQNPKDDRTLTWDDYEDLGGVTNSLTRRATEEYDNLAKDDRGVEIDSSEAQARQTMLRWVMLRMVTLDGGEKAKRRVLDSELEYADTTTKDVVIQKFVDARLLLTGTNIEGYIYFEPTHDVLVREWEKITTWLSETQEEVHGMQTQPNPNSQKKQDFQQKLFSIRWDKKPEKGQTRFNINLQREITIAANKWDSARKGESVEQNRQSPGGDELESKGKNKEASQKQPKTAVGWLWDRDPSLPLAEQVYQSTDNWLNKLEAEFVQESVSKSRRDTIVFVTSALVLLIAAIGAALFFNRLRLIEEKNRVNAEISLKSATAEKVFASNELEGLLAMLKVVQISEQEGEKISPVTRSRVAISLQKIIYGIKELNQLDGKSVAFSPDGQTIAIATNDNKVKLLKSSGEKILEFGKLKSAWGSTIVFSPDSQIIAILATDNAIKLYNLQGQEFPQALKLTESDFGNECVLAFSSDGHTLALACDYSNIVTLWNFKTNKRLKLEGRSVAFSPNGQTIATAVGNTVKLWNLQAKEIQTLKGHNSTVWSIAFSPDGQTIATASMDNTAKLWNLKGKELLTLKGHRYWVKKVAFSPDGQSIATTSQDRTVKLWNLQGQQLRTFTGHTSWVHNVVFSPDGQILASMSGDNIRNNIIKFWNLKGEKLQGFKVIGGVVNSIVFNPENQTLFLAREDGVEMVNFQGKLLKKLSSNFSNVAISRDGHTVATFGGDGTVKLRNLEGEEIETLSMNWGCNFLVGVNDVAFSPDGQTLATVCWEGTVKVWNLKTKTELNTLPGYHGSIWGGSPTKKVVFSPDGQMIASTTVDNSVKLWNWQKNKVKTISGHSQVVKSVAFSPDRQFLATGSQDRTIKLWNLEGEELQTLTGHGQAVNSVTFSPDSQILFSGGEDGTVKIWNLQGEELQTFTEHSQAVIALSPDGQTLVSTSVNGEVIVWNLNLKDLSSRSCDWLQAYFVTHPKVLSDFRICVKLNPNLEAIINNKTDKNSNEVAPKE